MSSGGFCVRAVRAYGHEGEEEYQREDLDWN